MAVDICLLAVHMRHAFDVEEYGMVATNDLQRSQDSNATCVLPVEDVDPPDCVALIYGQVLEEDIIKANSIFVVYWPPSLKDGKPNFIQELELSIAESLLEEEFKKQESYLRTANFSLLFIIKPKLSQYPILVSLQAKKLNIILPILNCNGKH